MREYTNEQFDDLPLFASPATIEPPTCVSDPPSAKSAARSQEARTAVVQSTARCLWLLAHAPDGFTDFEIVDAYHLAYPDSVRAKGLAGFVRMVTRSWCLLKPNDDIRNHKHENLNLIHRTHQTRINPHSGKPNVVFQFIQPPSHEQVHEWERLTQHQEENPCM